MFLTSPCLGKVRRIKKAEMVRGGKGKEIIYNVLHIRFSTSFLYSHPPSTAWSFLPWKLLSPTTFTKTEAAKKRKDHPIKKWSVHLNRHFSKDTNGQRAHEKMLNVLNYQTNANKTPMKYHLTLERMAIIKKPTKTKCWRGCIEMGTLVHCWWKSKLVHSIWRTV